MYTYDLLFMCRKYTRNLKNDESIISMKIKLKI